MIAHYVLWVAIAIATIVAVYGAYNYALSTVIDFHADNLENAFKLLAETSVGEVRQVVVSIPRGVTVDICGLNLEKNAYMCPSGGNFSTCGIQRYYSVSAGGTLPIELYATREGEKCTVTAVVKNSGKSQIVFDLGAGLALTGIDPRMYQFRQPIYLGDVGTYMGKPPHYTDISLQPGETREITFEYVCPKSLTHYFVVVAWRSEGEGWDLGTKSLEDIISYNTVRIEAALACVRITKWERATFVALPYNASSIGFQRLHVGIYRVSAYHVLNSENIKKCLYISKESEVNTPSETTPYCIGKIAFNIELIS